MSLSSLSPSRLVSHAAQTVGRAAHSLQRLPAAAGGAARSLLPSTYRVRPAMPGYTPIPAAALAAARARSAGLTEPQRFICNASGQPHEPVSFEVSGSLGQLAGALEKSGWVKAEQPTSGARLRTHLSLVLAATHLDRFVDHNEIHSPVSAMFVDGKPQVMAFEKNNDHHQARDHLRIFATGRTSPAGEPIWSIAATRDVAFSANLRTGSESHQIDPAIDRERDLVMADLLKSGAVRGWKVAQGQRTPQETARMNATYQTDGAVYLVELR